MKIVIKHDCTLFRDDDKLDAPNGMGILLFFISKWEQSPQWFEIRAFYFTIIA